MQLLGQLKFFLLAPILLAASQKCYVGPNQEYNGTAGLVPCSTTGESACCLRGSVCLAGNACWDPKTTNTYQYGCTDVNYRNEVCPFKCGWDSKKSPWTGLEICSDVVGVSETWICLSPEGYKHQWNASWELQNLTRTLCNDMGDNARVALYAPDPLAPYVSLPSSANGSTGYFKPTTTSGSITWDSIPLSGYTPETVAPFTTYSMPTTRVLAAATRNGTSSTRLTSTSGSAAVNPSTTSNLAAATTTSASPSLSSSSSGLSLGVDAVYSPGAIVGICLSAVFIGALFF